MNKPLVADDSDDGAATGGIIDLTVSDVKSTPSAMLDHQECRRRLAEAVRYYQGLHWYWECIPVAPGD
ncbi:uncharacterized protein N7515_004082 [Penicillium bovifimosum]|uniref:Uncharacterized protein n=1 Tax=Penicillium bovifimosum TaxID=126998 RepID=A0A9W9H7L6_9EURO|nr:uncharacterized protein N7515_004082 [Penicillium bovifimosum]KAJ5139234.1 hypothetical protein N7515_004082 [Penicillium bovifimosum]